jgi:DivIVA domain-containing protein
MIDLTPLDVRKKKGDFTRVFRGYDARQVEDFLDLVASRMEDLVRENAMLRDRSSQLAEALAAFRTREQAMNEALVSAQQMREEIKSQSGKEAELALREARAEGQRLIASARREVERERDALHRVQLERERFFRTYRAFLEGQLAGLEAEGARLRGAGLIADPPGAREGGDD